MDTKKGKNNTSESKGVEHAPVSLDKHLADLESKSIQFPDAGTTSAPVEKGSAVPTVVQKTEIATKESVAPTSIPTAGSVSNSDSKPVEKKKPEPVVEKKPEPKPAEPKKEVKVEKKPAPALSAIAEVDSEGPTKKTVVVFGVGVIIGALITSFFI